MTEWAVGGVLIALAGLFATVAKPMITLNKTLTELTITVKGLKSDMDGLSIRNTRSHERIWIHSEEQDRKLAEHEKRIGKLEDHDERREVQ